MNHLKSVNLIYINIVTRADIQYVLSHAVNHDAESRCDSDQDPEHFHKSVLLPVAMDYENNDDAGYCWYE